MLPFDGPLWSPIIRTLIAIIPINLRNEGKEDEGLMGLVLTLVVFNS